MRIRIVDAFTDQPFAGNPAGVLLLDSGAFPADSWMQRVAAEMNLSETAFAHRLAGAEDADWALRWFTPATEVRLCGHATLATAHVLRTTGAARGTIRFRTRQAGVLSASASGDGTITLDFPRAPLSPAPGPEGLAAALGAEPVTVLDTGPDLGDLLVEVADEGTVRGLAPDFAALARASYRGVIATAAADPGKGYDFVSRGFFPGVGVDEDPVTGSAHTALAPFWSDRLGREALTGLQVSARTGSVATRLSGDRVLLTGSAVTVVDGELHAVP